MAFSIVSVKLPTGDTALCGVTLEPYVVLKKLSDGTQVTADEGYEEGTSDGTYLLRSRWFRSTIGRAGAVCSVHPDKEGTVQCTICAPRGKAHPPPCSFHCSSECMKQHWHLHKELHRQAYTNGQDNGYDYHYFKGGSSIPSNSEGWHEVGKTRLYTPTPEDVGFVLKYECSVNDSRNPSDMGRQHTFTFMTARVRPAPSPPTRAMITLPTPPNVQTTTAGKFTILSYNILAELYATSEMHPCCPSWALSWQYRKINLLKEILNYRADILCLQEVQSDHYHDYLVPELQKHGYIAIYKKKTKEMYTGAGHTIDGCATFFRKSKFALVKKYEVEFNKAAVSLADQLDTQHKKQAAMNRLMKDNVALIAVLEALDVPIVDGAQRRQMICVANTHIHANKDMNDVKLWQVHTLLKGLEKIAASADIPMLVAGDFNSLPGSAAHQLLVGGQVKANLASIDPLGLVADTKLHHTLPLCSAYSRLSDVLATTQLLQRQKARLDPQHKEPMYTNLGKEFRGTLDYILYTKDSLIPVGLLEIPNESDLLCRPDESLPNANWSSDHVALLAEFQYSKA